MKNKALVLLSGEPGSIPAAEARALFRAYDPSATFEQPSPRVVVAESAADPFLVGRRIAFARRVGVVVRGARDAEPLLKGRKVRFRCFDLRPGRPPPDPEPYLRGVEAEVDLRAPELEVTLVRGEEEYLAVTSPGTMLQGWSIRRPRRRPFFHPSAIFPKLSRALVNLTGCVAGDVLLDPFAGTGSLLLEATLVGACAVAMDQVKGMALGEVKNMKHFGQEWLGALRADAGSIPLRRADAVATDMPYGRVSSTRGKEPQEILGPLFAALGEIMPPGGGLVLMHRKEVPVEGGRLFSVVEEHDLHVHKLLTRTISVLRRR
ncbi:MAG: hypothetical protein JRN16_04740 [Nitrososphaerota archaeon]|nr:hypothetical protein [Nitrososphaerota archaeon]MDG6975691.1 hypothetical protein [Nitrososphaerota archaeon]MDG7010251.1 hypothetical protein [Nitrososphaerota archaeon]MDG7027695.1 hypothetical protein [Nitrososphaerota archaeon]